MKKKDFALSILCGAMLFSGSLLSAHPALVTQEQWDIVQDVRKHKKRTPKHMDEPNIFSGPAFCMDCGKPMVLHRASTMRKQAYNFKCYPYGKKGQGLLHTHPRSGGKIVSDCAG